MKQKKMPHSGEFLTAAVVSTAVVMAYLLVISIGAGSCGESAGSTPPPISQPSEPPKEDKAPDAEAIKPEINNNAAIDFLYSEEVSSKLLQLRKYERAERWMEAVSLCQSLLEDSAATDCVPSGDDGLTVISLRRHIQRRISKYPPEALKLYRARYDSAAADILDSAAREGRIALVRRVAERCLLTSSGPRALRMLAAEAFERADMLEAASHLEGIAEFFPGGWTARDLVLLIRCYSLLGEVRHSEQARKTLEERFAQADVMVGGRKINAVKYAASIPMSVAADGGIKADWLVADGSSTGQVDLASFPKIGRSVWSAELNVPNSRGARFAAVQDNILYINSGRDVVAYSLRSGRGPLWKFSLESSLDADSRMQPSKRREVTGNVQGWPSAVSLSGDRLYSTLFGTLFCLNSQTGRLLWLGEVLNFGKRPGAFEQRIMLCTAPLVQDGEIFTGGIMHGGSIDDTYLLYCHDALTGRMKWQRELCYVPQVVTSASRGTTRRPAGAFSTPAVLRKARGLIIFCSNDGIVAAVNSRGGEVVWISRYDRGKGYNSVDMLRGNWAFETPIVACGKLIVTPQDSSRIHAFDLRTGRSLWHRENEVSGRGCPGRLVAVDGAEGLVFLGGAKITAYDLNGKTILPPMTVPGRVVGRGLLAGGMLYVPTGRGLAVVDIKASVAAGAFKMTLITAWEGLLSEDRKSLWPDKEEERFLTVACVSDSLVLCTGRRVFVLYDAKSVEARLRAEASGDRVSSDAARLELARVLAAQGGTDAALSEYSRAAARLRARARREERFDEEAYLSYRGASPMTLKRNSLLLMRARGGAAQTSYLAGLRVLKQSPGRVDYAALAAKEISPQEEKQAAQYIERAKQYSTDAEGFINAQLVLLARYRQGGQWQKCVDCLVDIGRKYGSEVYDFRAYAPEVATIEVGLFVTERVGALLKEHGRGLYSRYESSVLVLLRKAQASGTPDDYYEAVRRYPNSLRARGALLKAMEISGEKLRYRDLIYYAHNFLWRYPDDSQAVTARALMAKGCEALGLVDEGREALGDLVAFAEKKGIRKVSVEGVSQTVSEYVGAMRKRLDSAGNSRVSSFGDGRLRIMYPMPALSDMYLGETVLLYPGGCAPEGMEEAVYLLAGSGKPGHAVLRCIHSGSLREMWSVVLPMKMMKMMRMFKTSDYSAGYSGGSLVLKYERGIVGLDPRGGFLRWVRAIGQHKGSKVVGVGRTEMPGGAFGPIVTRQYSGYIWAAIGNSSVYYVPATDAQILYAVDSRTGKLKWKADLGGTGLPGAIFVGANLVVPVEVRVPKSKPEIIIKVINRLDGAVKWRIKGLTPLQSVEQRGENPLTGPDERTGAGPKTRLFAIAGLRNVLIEMSRVGCERFVVLSRNGAALYDTAKQSREWLNPDIGFVDGMRREPCPGRKGSTRFATMKGPEPGRRLLVGAGWCGVASDHCSRIRVFDLQGGKLIRTFEPTRDWLISDWLADGDRVHLFSFSWTGRFIRTSAKCFRISDGKLLFENLFDTGDFRYRPVLTRGHVVYVREYRHARRDGTARIYVYSRQTGKIAASPVEVSDMACDKTGQAIDTNGCILVKSRFKIVAIKVETVGDE